MRCSTAAVAGAVLSLSFIWNTGCTSSDSGPVSGGAGTTGDSDASEASAPDTGDDTTAQEAEPMDAGVEAEVGADADASPLLTPNIYLWSRYSDAGRQPLEGASVAVDLPGGGHAEATTGADGRASFDADWSKGTAAVTAWKQGTSMFSWLGVSAASANVGIVLQPLEAPQTVTVTGNGVNMTDATKNWLAVSSTAADTSWYDKAGAAYNLDLRVGESFVIVADEWTPLTAPCPRCLAQQVFGWVAINHAAISAPLTLDIAFSHKIADVHHFSGHATVPTATDSVLRQSDDGLIAYVIYSESALTGLLTNTQLNADESAFNYVGEYVDVGGTAPVVTRYMLNGYPSPSLQVVSYIDQKGFPQDGATISGFLEPANITKPADPTTPTSILDPVVWTGAAPDARPYLEIISDSGIWIVGERVGITSITVPAPPSVVDLATFLGASPTGLVFLGSDSDPDTGDYTKYSTSIPFQLSL